MELKRRISHWWYLYELWTGLYMLDKTEKFIFNFIVATIWTLSLYYGAKHAGLRTPTLHDFVAVFRLFGFGGDNNNGSAEIEQQHHNGFDSGGGQ